MEELWSSVHNTECLLTTGSARTLETELSCAPVCRSRSWMTDADPWDFNKFKFIPIRRTVLSPRHCAIAAISNKLSRVRYFSILGGSTVTAAPASHKRPPFIPRCSLQPSPPAEISVTTHSPSQRGGDWTLPQHLTDCQDKKRRRRAPMQPCIIAVNSVTALGQAL